MSRSVLLVTQQLAGTRSGVGLYARLLLQELVARGRAVGVATWTSEVDRDAFPDTEFVELGERPVWDPTPGSFVALGRRLATVLRDRDHPFALVHFTDAREIHGYLQRSREGDRPLLTGTVHDDYAARAPASPYGLVGQAADPYVRWAYYRWLRGVERRAYAHHPLLMVNSRATGDSVVSCYGVDAARLRRVHLGIAADVATATGGAAFDGDPTILFAGGNFYRKGLHVLVQALPAVLRDAPAARLHVAGRDGAEGRVRRLADSLGVSDAVTFHGRLGRDAMAGGFAAADVFAMPSRTEALGLVYLEAMRAGVPVVSGNVGGVVEIVRDGESGLTVTPTDADAVAAAILRVHRDAALRERLVAGGRTVVAARTPQRLADETEAVYDELLTG
jgi:glycosyltransferase involved in cell wall biosynthesis